MPDQKSKTSIRRAVKERGFLYPAFKPSVRRFLILAAKPYLRIVEGITKVEYIHEERIIEAMQKFHNGEQRLIFVFRHAAKEDPPVLMYTFLNPLRRKIQKGTTGISHIMVLYGRDVPNWAGKITEWLFPRIGAIPVQAHNGNKEALSIIHREMKDGPFPIALAPEEQVVYHMYKCFDIAPGVSSLVRWGLESEKPVAVVPLTMGYSYDKNPEAFIRNQLGKWEQLTGISLENRKTGKLHGLLCRATEETLSLIEPLCGILPSMPGQNPEKIDERIKTLCTAFLSEAENISGLSGDGNISDRLFRIRYAGYDSFYPNTDPEDLPSFRRSILDFQALKAEVFIRYERITDVLEYIHMSYIAPPFSAGRGCEFILNLLDVINRASGGDISEHSIPSNLRAVVLAGEPQVYTPDKSKESGRREFVELVKKDIKNSLEKASAELEHIWEKIKLE